MTIHNAQRILDNIRTTAGHISELKRLLLMERRNLSEREPDRTCDGWAKRFVEWNADIASNVAMGSVADTGVYALETVDRALSDYIRRQKDLERS